MQPFSASVCVFCGARDGNDAQLVVRARETGAILARNRWRLVFGAGDMLFAPVPDIPALEAALRDALG